MMGGQYIFKVSNDQDDLYVLLVSNKQPHDIGVWINDLIATKIELNDEVVNYCKKYYYNYNLSIVHTFDNANLDEDVLTTAWNNAIWALGDENYWIKEFDTKPDVEITDYNNAEIVLLKDEDGDMIVPSVQILYDEDLDMVVYNHNDHLEDIQKLEHYELTGNVPDGDFDMWNPTVVRTTNDLVRTLHQFIDRERMREFNVAAPNLDRLDEEDDDIVMVVSIGQTALRVPLKQYSKDRESAPAA